MNLWRWVTGLSLVMLLGACTTPQPSQKTLEPQATYWQQVGSSVATGQSVSLAQTSDGNPVIAYTSVFEIGTSTDIYVKRWNGSNWVQLGGTLDTNTNHFVYEPSLALDSFGNPVVSWQEADSSSQNIHVKRWNGSSCGYNWVLVWILFLTLDAIGPSLALDSSAQSCSQLE